MPQRMAEGVLRHVDALIQAKLTNMALSPDTASWLGKLDDTLYGRIAAAGLVAPRSSTSLGAFLDKLFTGLSVKPETLLAYGHVRRCLKEYFTPEIPLRDITPADADAFKSWLANNQKLSTATTARRIIAARQFFRIAMRWDLVDKNVFDGVKGGGQSNEKRKHYVPLDVVAKILGACPDVQWRCIIALSRFAGIRVPSELLPLRWTDVDWQENSIVIHSPKTEHHEGGASRTIPLFAELRPYLLEAFEAAPEGTEYVITAYRDTTQNLRTQFERIAVKAGVAMWPKPFHNMRASRESELMREYDLATVCRWIGNSPAIAAKHYATSIDLNADFKRASGQAVQNAVQHLHETPCKAVKPDSENIENSRQCTNMHYCSYVDMGAAGFEPA
ncbi:MAG: tyrosine-type recombinase/integrase [Phycisphaerae bacterium]